MFPIPNLVQHQPICLVEFHVHLVGVDEPGWLLSHPEATWNSSTPTTRRSHPNSHDRAVSVAVSVAARAPSPQADDLMEPEDYLMDALNGVSCRKCWSIVSAANSKSLNPVIPSEGSIGAVSQRSSVNVAG